MAAQLTIVAVPEPQLVFTNHIYLSNNNPLVTESQKIYIKLNDKIYVAKTHPSIKNLNCGVSAIQRQTLGVSINDTILADSVTHFDIQAFSIQLQVFTQKKQDWNVKESELVSFIKKSYTGQIFSSNQLVCFDYNGHIVNFKVLSLERYNNYLTENVSQALLVDETVIELDAINNKYFTLEKDTKNKRKSKILMPDFKFTDLGIGGLDAEFSLLFRRSFASRLVPPETAQKLGIKHVKGILLHGPPGTGKTLIARQIGKTLAAREPKIVNGPEVLNKFVGQSEENVRKLFADAEKDYKENGENADLHIIIFDEIDAICKTRGRGNDSTGVNDSVINQLLSQIDGVNQLNNILIIGMTNRKDMIDPALLRPGRLEVHIEIGLPDEQGRLQILNIHTSKMRENNVLASDVNLEHIASVTKNFSGAEIESLVKSASSFALSRTMEFTQAKFTQKDVEVLVSMNEFNAALDEIKPAFGVDEEELSVYTKGELYDYGDEFQTIMMLGKELINQVSNENSHTSLLTFLLEGTKGSGKTSIAAKLAVDSGFSYVKVINPVQFVGVSENKKINDIVRVFEDSYKSPLSLIILDNIEGLLEYIHIGPRFNASVLQALMTYMTKPPPIDKRKLIIIGTSSRVGALKELELYNLFNVKQFVPALNDKKQFIQVLKKLGNDNIIQGDESQFEEIAKCCNVSIPIKQFLMLIELSKKNQNCSIQIDKFQKFIQITGLNQ